MSDASLNAAGARPLMTARGLRRELVRLRLSLTAGWTVREPVVIAAGVLALLSAYFTLLPSVDLAVSALFHSPAGFALSSNPVLTALRKSSSYALMLLVLGLLGEVAVGVLSRTERLRDYSRRALVLLVGLALGPGLVVNGILKSMWGRPRPIQVDVFGGDAPFVSAWRLSEECARNCSFVSGEASSAAWMVAAVWVMTPPEWRRYTVPGVLAYAGALSINRIAFGGHFLSDVVLSWSITALVLTGLFRLALTCPRAALRARSRRRLGGVA